MYGRHVKQKESKQWVELLFGEYTPLIFELKAITKGS